MKIVFRWFGESFDSIALSQIKQIPQVHGIVTSLLDKQPGELWELDEITKIKERIASFGFSMDVIESVNVHEDIKLGVSSRDFYIENYIKTIANLSKAGVKVLCYNLMPAFDWARSELARKMPDGSEVMSYRHADILKLDPKTLVDSFDKQSGGFDLPGWEPDRLKEISNLIEIYNHMPTEAYWKNVKYFLNAVIPYAEKYDVKMAIHPDDPPWQIFGLPKVISNRENIQKFLALYDSPHNGLSICSGSLGANPANDIPAIIREFGAQGKIHFGHVRNIIKYSEKDFDETAHNTCCGSLDLFEIMKAYFDVGFEGYIRPDHGRMIWGEKARPGYGLYDRALGISYLNGLWEAITKMNKLR